MNQSEKENSPLCDLECNSRTNKKLPLSVCVCSEGQTETLTVEAVLEGGVVVGVVVGGRCEVLVLELRT